MNIATPFTDMIFREKADIVIDAHFVKYRTELHDYGLPKGVPEWFIRNLSALNVEASSRLAYILSQHKPAYFVEAASGMGIPAIALSKLGFKGYAFDKNETYVRTATSLAIALDLPINFKVCDFHSWDEPMPEGSFLIAERPRDEDNSFTLERAIYHKAIEYGVNLALAPYHNTSTVKPHAGRGAKGKKKKKTRKAVDQIGEGVEHIIRRCKNYAKGLRLNGYHVEITSLTEGDYSLRLILGVK